jgi:prepilin-type N-terminal cleavage/methylation domain-containing protein
MAGSFRKICNSQSATCNRRGFTLIEVLIAIGILAIGISAVLFLFAMGARSHKQALDRTRAALLADAVVNGLQAEFPSFSDPTKPQPITKATRPDFPGYHYNVTFTPLYGQTNYYKVSVVVAWGDPNAPPDPRASETYDTVLQRKAF